MQPSLRVAVAAKAMFAAACLASAHDDAGTQSEAAAVSEQGECAGRDAQICAPDCHSLYAMCPGEDGGPEHTYVGCARPDLMCTGAETCALSPDGSVCLFAGGGAGCVPNGWSEEPDGHEAECEAVRRAQRQSDGGAR